MAYATVEQLEAWLGDQPAPTHAERLLERASERVDDLVTAPYAVDGAGLPTDSDVQAVFANATCAVVEYWLEVGEPADIVSLAGAISFDGLSLSEAPSRYPPRAVGLLRRAGLRGEPRMV